MFTFFPFLNKKPRHLTISQHRYVNWLITLSADRFSPSLMPTVVNQHGLHVLLKVLSCFPFKVQPTPQRTGEWRDRMINVSEPTRTLAASEQRRRRRP